ncbi:hypothetical protein H2200_011336 [Cladophialophora chaetospira]|uniref:DUF302 domain-containing protein n=1 Tax=Cladophialophora chaetospira TaxID=386627 RepID=A0AA38X0F9_9EURO|nr:hypothetical protein H2200_011336 [Cladophialophora chaetospira]
MTTTIEKQPIPAERLIARSPISFAKADARLRSSIQKSPNASPSRFQDQKAKYQLGEKEAYEAWVRSRVGPHGFMYFNEFNHGRWLPLFEPPTATFIDMNGEKKALRATRFILGNPLIAITMLRHDLDAGLCVPVELYLVEEVKGGVRIVWYKPSSLIAGYEGAKQDLVDAAEVLSAKLEVLVNWVLREEETEERL